MISTVPSVIQQSLWDTEPDKPVRLAPQKKRAPRFHAIPNPQRLESEVMKLFAERKHAGVWADHVFEIGKRLGVCAEVDRKEQRANSWSGPFLNSLASRKLVVRLRRADGSMIKTRSNRIKSHANEQTVYTLPEYQDRAVYEFTRPRSEVSR